jgi:hypothetical protein
LARDTIGERRELQRHLRPGFERRKPRVGLQPMSSKIDPQFGNVGFDRGYIGFDPKDAGRDGIELADEVGLVRVDARFERVDARSKASTERGDCGEDFVFVSHRFRSVRPPSASRPPSPAMLRGARLLNVLIGP